MFVRIAPGLCVLSGSSTARPVPRSACPACGGGSRCRYDATRPCGPILTTHQDRSARPLTFAGPTRRNHQLRPRSPIAHQVVNARDRHRQHRQPRAPAQPGRRRADRLRTADFAATARDVDVVLDCVGGDSPARSLRTLRRGGTLISLIPIQAEVAEEAARLGIRAGVLLVEADHAGMTSIADLARRLGQAPPGHRRHVPADRHRQGPRHRRNRARCRKTRPDHALTNPARTGRKAAPATRAKPLPGPPMTECSRAFRPRGGASNRP